MNAFPPINDAHPDYSDQPGTRFVTVIPFSFSPPLTANQRLHWANRADKTKTLRTLTAYHARRFPELGKCRVTLTWYVKTKHRRDADNIVPTLKAMCDGLVDAGVVTDDTPDLMVKDMPVITYDPYGAPRMELRIEKL